MKVLITGVCGFAGSSIARFLLSSVSGCEIVGIDNLSRSGSEINRLALAKLGVDVRHGDLRIQSDLEGLPPVDWVIDAAALPTVLGGVDGRSSSLQLVQHNLLGTVHLLEYCRQHSAGLVLLSTSRVYSIESLRTLHLQPRDGAFQVVDDGAMPAGVTANGLTEQFSTEAPVSLYGATKIASEALAREYAMTFQFPVVVNRCGVLAGAGQFGRADQGIFSFWIHRHRYRKSLSYIGFGGHGHQVRDCLNIRDLGRLVHHQITHTTTTDSQPIVHASGGADRSMSLNQLTRWCDERFGVHPVVPSDQERPFDLPWVVLDASLAKEHWGWEPEISLNETLSEIADHADAHPDWLELSQ